MIERIDSTEDALTVLLCGVGGQGTILAADLLAKASIASKMEVKLSEIHGMAQRGGSVTTVVRMGTAVNSMVCDPGTADCVLAFETTEALRNLVFLKVGGSLLVNDSAIKPLPVLTGRSSMPLNARNRLKQVGGILVPADELARQAGNAKCANVVLLGALAARLPFDSEVWRNCIKATVPTKTIDSNLAAFDAGMSSVLGEDK